MSNVHFKHAINVLELIYLMSMMKITTFVEIKFMKPQPGSVKLRKLKCCSEILPTLKKNSSVVIKIFSLDRGTRFSNGL